jgi:hypothetical protein
MVASPGRAALAFHSNTTAPNRHDRFAPHAICAATKNCENLRSGCGIREDDAMTPEEALNNILELVEGSDEVEDAHALQILLQSIKTLAEKGLGRAN